VIDFTSDKFNSSYNESSLNSDVDKVMFSIYGPHYKASQLCQDHGLQYCRQLVIWSDQKRVGKVFLLRSADHIPYVSIQMRLEFVASVSLPSVLFALRNHLIDVSFASANEILHVLYFNLAQGESQQFLPDIAGFRWVSVK